MTHVKTLLDQIHNNQELSDNVVYWNTQPAQPGEFAVYPKWISPQLTGAYESLGIKQLYSHQIEALEQLSKGKNVVISTGTASGKSLCYQIPILNKAINDGLSTALLFFPTKALTFDQYKSFSAVLEALELGGTHKLLAEIYDGDTPPSRRNAIRKEAKIILTNPDMMNIAILPHHTLWSEYFSNLKYIVIDEIHLYRGVFGSHIANLIRRIKRIANFYGSSPKMIMTSATIANPKELASNLIEEDVVCIENDGSPKGQKHFLIYNPPIVNQELGIREGMITTIPKISVLLYCSNIQTLVFCKTRRFVELLIREIKYLNSDALSKVRGYRSGYLKKDRRDIEDGLKNGTISLAIATNALELGVDIGGVDAVICAGYPGSVCSLKQRIGRSGRSLNPSVAFLVTSMNPLDQFFARNPDYLINRPLEQALIDPDNPLILLSHIKSAAFELPFEEMSNFGSLKWEQLQEYLDYLVETGFLQKRKGKYFWLSEKYPSNDYSLRSTISEKILLQYEGEAENEIIGEVDYNSALWMVHPGAVYLQDGVTFFVKSLDLEKGIALLTSSFENYLTEPIITVSIDVLSSSKEKKVDYFTQYFGEIVVTSKVTGFKRIHNQTHEILETTSLELPENTLQTTGFWIELSETCVAKMREEKMWLSDPNEYGKNWKSIRETVRQRDDFTCQSCGRKETGEAFHVHHKIPFKTFTDIEKANDINNLVTLCPDCHRRVETNSRIRSGLSGLKYLLANMAPLLVLCDVNDLGSYADPKSSFSNNNPVILLYDSIPAGIGLSSNLYDRIDELLSRCMDVISECECSDGCPSCVGPNTESGSGGKKETQYLLELILSQVSK